MLNFGQQESDDMTISQNPFGCTAREAIALQSEQTLRINSPDYVESDLRKALCSLLPAEVKGVPPPNNMGGQEVKPPMFFSQCEKSAQIDDKNITKIDWLGFTAVQDLPTIHLAVEIIFPHCSFHPMPKGMRGYPKSEAVAWNGQQIGVIGFGASHDRIFVSLPGTGCSALSPSDIRRAYDVLCMIGARIARVDVALDFFNGERTWDHALFCYERGDFNRARSGGKKPYLKKFDQSDDGANLGRTMYVNRRESEVMARIYEKGLELFANMPLEYKTLSALREIEYVNSGSSVPFADTWLRVEIEFKRVESDRPIPLEILIERDNYFAGSFPYCAAVLEHATPSRPKDLRTEKEVDLIKLLASARNAYGSLVYTLSSLGYSDTDIREVLSNGKQNRRLQESGMLSFLEKAVADFRQSNPDSDIPF